MLVWKDVKIAPLKHEDERRELALALRLHARAGPELRERAERGREGEPGGLKGRFKSFSGASLLDRACRRECCALSHMMTGLSVLCRGDLFGILSCIRSCILSHIWSDPGAIYDGGDHRGPASDFCRLGGHFGSSSPSGTLPCVVLYLVSYFVLYLVSET